MNLTEPQCGTDLGLIRTKAVPQADGSYAHHRPEDLHLRRRARPRREHRPSRAGAHRGRAGGHQGPVALRRAEVPARRRPASPARATRVSCGSLEEKMGIHGNATCVMNYDGATGWLVGERGQGPPRHVHDDERGAPRRRASRGSRSPRSPARTPPPMPATAARAARSPAPRSRTQPPTRSSSIPTSAASLMTIRAFNEAARALLLWTALQGDLAHRAATMRRSAQAADDRMGLLTPVLKGVLTDKGFDNAVAAQQVFGGHGYIAEMGHGAVRPRCPHRHDLRGRQRHPGARPRRPQAAEGRRPRGRWPSSPRSAPS